MIATRRGLLGMFAAGAAAAIVRPGLLMPVKPVRRYMTLIDYAERVGNPAMEAHIAQLSQAIFYGDDDFKDVAFQGFMGFGSTPIPGDTLTLNGETFTFRKAA